MSFFQPKLAVLLRCLLLMSQCFQVDLWIYFIINVLFLHDSFSHCPCINATTPKQHRNLNISSTRMYPQQPCTSQVHLLLFHQWIYLRVSKDKKAKSRREYSTRVIRVSWNQQLTKEMELGRKIVDSVCRVQVSTCEIAVLSLHPFLSFFFFFFP